jgi:hypothetical protein
MEPWLEPDCAQPDRVAVQGLPLTPRDRSDRLSAGSRSPAARRARRATVRSRSGSDPVPGAAGTAVPERSESVGRTLVVGPAWAAPILERPAARAKRLLVTRLGGISPAVRAAHRRQPTSARLAPVPRVQGRPATGLPAADTSSARDTTGIRISLYLCESPALRGFRMGRGGLEPPTYGL